MPEELELVKKAQNRDTEAFAQLYESVYKDLYRFALYMLGHREDAEDAVSETVLSVYRQIPSLREPSAFRAWIFRILSNQCMRRRKEYTNRTEELPEELPGEGRDHAEDLAVLSLLDTLTEEERLILSLHLFAGYTSREIGSMLSMNDATVRSKEHRALEKLRNGGLNG